jgi:hypothetical protein
MNIETPLWTLISFNEGYVHVIQKASGTTRTVSRGHIPSVETLAAMTERQFNRVCREAFHGER